MSVHQCIAHRTVLKHDFEVKRSNGINLQFLKI